MIFLEGPIPVELLTAPSFLELLRSLEKESIHEALKVVRFKYRRRLITGRRRCYAWKYLGQKKILCESYYGVQT